MRVLVPEQDVRGGQVRLQVIEAKLRRIRVEGSRFFGDQNVRASVPAVTEGVAPDTRRIGQQVQLANENPMKQSSVVLESADEPGKVGAVIRVAD